MKNRIILTKEEKINLIKESIPISAFIDLDVEIVDEECGKGELLKEILLEKLKHCETKDSELEALATIKGYDMDFRNVIATRNLLFDIMKRRGFNLVEVLKIVDKNIQERKNHALR